MPKRMVAIIAGMMMLVVASGAVLMIPDGSSYTTAVESVVVATENFVDPPTMQEVCCEEKCEYDCHHEQCI